MRHARKEQDSSPVSEMAIVNTFTKLIFGDDAYTARELSIIEALRLNSGGALCENRRAMGDYLRNLGVREMIDLVSGLRQSLAECSKPAIASDHRPSSATVMSLRS